MKVDSDTLSGSVARRCSLSWADLSYCAKQHGLDLISVTHAEPATDELVRFKSWQEEGNAGGMEYMLRPAIDYLTPSTLVPGAQSILSIALRYPAEVASPRAPGTGRVARYAWGKDYHKVMQRRLKAFANDLHVKCDSISFRVASDAVPLHERIFAARGGLGFIGKNTLVIRPREGSYFLLGEIISTLEVKDVPVNQVHGACGTCTRCSVHCPTGALSTPYSIDARKCISYLTIEKRGMLTRNERRSIGEWIFGCDLCQEVCPFNYAPTKEQRGYESDFRAVPPIEGGTVSLETILAIETDDAFRTMWSHSPVRRAKREGLIRNACCVAVNTDAHHLLPLLLKCAGSDTSPIVRAHAIWACWLLQDRGTESTRSRIRALLGGMQNDPSPIVREEVRAIIESSCPS